MPPCFARSATSRGPPLQRSSNRPGRVGATWEVGVASLMVGSGFRERLMRPASVVGGGWCVFGGWRTGGRPRLLQRRSPADLLEDAAARPAAVLRGHELATEQREALNRHGVAIEAG